MTMRSHLSARLVLATVLAVGAAAVAAQPYPNRPVRFVVPYGAGGAPDVFARALSQKLGERLGQQVVVDNRPGAGGIIAAELVQKSPPDGYTLFIADTGHFAINVSLYPKLPYDPVKHFTPVINAVSTPLVMAVGTAVPAQNVQELIALARSRPEGLAYGSSGNGSPHHLAMAQVRALTQANFSHVPYKGVAQSVPALISGDVAVIFVGLPSIQPHVRSGKARLIAVNMPRRTSLLPELPTVAEQGLPGFGVTVSIGLLAPAGTPAPIVNRLNADVNAIIAEPEFEERMKAIGIVREGGSPAQFGEIISGDIERYARIVRETGARVD